MNIKKKLKSALNYILNYRNYINFYKKLPLEEKSILIESQHGSAINGNIFYFVKEFCENDLYKDYNIYLSFNKKSKEKILKVLESHKFNKVKLIEINTKKYFKVLATAKYLINDVVFSYYFIKKEGQVYLNTWHGTPLKTLGRKIKNDPNYIGNTQKNFTLADYLLYPNEYTRDHMVEDYMIDNISPGKVLLAGYPRNAEFFNDENKSVIRKKYNMENKQIIGYMPTWRGLARKQNTKEQENKLKTYFDEIEQLLSDDQILYVNLHPIEKALVNYDEYKKIKPFPEEYETYEFLNCCDQLITDYSSVFFDYAITKRKIILFAYDKEEYLADRGLYFSMDELPFPMVADIPGLIKEINSKKQYDDTEFINKFCKYDAKDITSKICELMILQKENDLIVENIKNNNKENVLIYAGNLANNDITESIKKIFASLDKTKRNYYIYFTSKEVQKNIKELIELPDDIKYISDIGKMNLNLTEKIIYMLHKYKLISTNKYMKIMDNAYKYEIKRIFGDSKFSKVIQFNGNPNKKTLLFSKFDCPKTIFVQESIEKIIKSSNKLKKNILKYAYNKYDNVVVTDESLLKYINIYVKDKSKIHVINKISEDESNSKEVINNFEKLLSK